MAGELRKRGAAADAATAPRSTRSTRAKAASNGQAEVKPEAPSKTAESRKRSNAAAKSMEAVNKAQASSPLDHDASHSKPQAKRRRTSKAAKDVLQHGTDEIAAGGDTDQAAKPSAVTATAQAAQRQLQSDAPCGAAPAADAACPADAPDALEAEDADFSAEHALTMEAAAAAAAAKSFDPCSRDHIALAYAALHADASVGERPTSSQDGPCSSSSGPASTSGAPFGRERQFKQLHGILHKACQEGLGRAIYISGLPGTGKSHTMRAVLAALSKQRGQTQPYAVFMSCFGLKEPSDVYAALVNACQEEMAGSGRNSAAAHDRVESDPERAHHQLVSLLQASGKKVPKSSKAAAKASSEGRMFVLVLDEVDRLLARGTNDLYKLFMLPHVTGARCCVVAMANSIDITERCLPALKCRGCAPEFIPFTAYARPQVLSILNAKLATLPWPVFDSVSLELVARKVASSTGDLRKAFQACRLALRLLHEHSVASRDVAGAAGSGAAVDGAAVEASAEAGAGVQSEAVPKALARVTVKEMAAAMARMSYQSDASAGHVAAIRGLPQQQLMHLLALATAVATEAAKAAQEAAAAASAREHGISTDLYKSKYYWGPSTTGPKATKASNPFAAGQAGAAAASPAPTYSAKTAAPHTPAPVMLAGDAARLVLVHTVYEHYRQMCSQMFQQPASEQEFRTTLELLSHVGLVAVSGSASTPASTLSRGGAHGGPKGAGSRGGDMQLGLKVQIRDIQVALKENVVFKKVLSSLPAA